MAVEKGRTGLWLPTSAQIHEKKPMYFCTLCDWKGYKGEDRLYERHMVDHARKGDARPYSLRLKAPGLFDPTYEGSDVEWGAWVAHKSETDPEGAVRWMKTSDGKGGGGLGDG